MKHRLRLLFLGIALASTIVGEAAVCIWDSTTFPGSYGCTNESCGSGCGSPYGYVAHWACKAASANSGNGCCICSWDTWTCSCTFGTGTGSVSSQFSAANGTCPQPPSGGPQPTSCLGIAP